MVFWLVVLEFLGWGAPLEKEYLKKNEWIQILIQSLDLDSKFYLILIIPKDFCRLLKTI